MCALSTLHRHLRALMLSVFGPPLRSLKWLPDAYYGNEDSGGVRGHYYHVFNTVRARCIVAKVSQSSSCLAPVFLPVATVLQVASSVCANIDMNRIIIHVGYLTDNLGVCALIVSGKSGKPSNFPQLSP
jgi:hypothetical protein